MAIQIQIGGIDRTKSIDLHSLRVENILTDQVDRCSFTLRKYGDSKTYTPTVGKEVIVMDGSSKVFGGVITKIDQGSDDYKIIQFEVECNDYTRLLDRYLVNDSYEDKTINYIINDIIVNKGLDTAGFTQTNVNCSKVVAYVAFKYESVHQVFKQLADLVNYYYYVDYDKDIHFFSKDENDAPFDIADDTGTYIFNTMVIRKDNSQVRNVVYVRGGEYLGAAFTTDFISDAEQNIYTLPYRYDSVQVSVTGEIWSGGIDGKDNATDYDYMWNQEEKMIRLRGDRIPSNGSHIGIYGSPYLPVVVKVRNQESIDTMASAEGGTGEYEHIILDPSIDSRQGARERASADLEAYKDTLVEGEFVTYTTGLKAGQKIRINSIAHSIDDYYIINKVVASIWTQDKFVYQVSLVSTRTLGIIEFLQNILMSDKKKIIINPNDVLDVVESFDSENLSITESVEVGLDYSDEAFTTGINMNESFTAQALDYETEFVLDPYTWQGEGSGDHKRLFRLNYSPLG